MPSAPAFERARRAVILLWIALGATLSAWSLADGSTPGGMVLALITVGPLLLPLPGLWAGRRRSYRWAPLTLAPALACSLTELVANPPQRALAAFVALLSFLCLAAIVAALRSMPPD